MNLVGNPMERERPRELGFRAGTTVARGSMVRRLGPGRAGPCGVHFLLAVRRTRATVTIGFRRKVGRPLYRPRGFRSGINSEPVPRRLCFPPCGLASLSHSRANSSAHFIARPMHLSGTTEGNALSVAKIWCFVSQQAATPGILGSRSARRNGIGDDRRYILMLLERSFA